MVQSWYDHRPHGRYCVFFCEIVNMVKPVDGSDSDRWQYCANIWNHVHASDLATLRINPYAKNFWRDMYINQLKDGRSPRMRNACAPVTDPAERNRRNGYQQEIVQAMGRLGGPSARDDPNWVPPVSGRTTGSAAPRARGAQRNVAPQPKTKANSNNESDDESEPEDGNGEEPASGRPQRSTRNGKKATYVINSDSSSDDDDSDDALEINEQKFTAPPPKRKRLTGNKTSSAPITLTTPLTGSSSSASNTVVTTSTTQGKRKAEFLNTDDQLPTPKRQKPTAKHNTEINLLESDSQTSPPASSSTKSSSDIISQSNDLPTDGDVPEGSLANDLIQFGRHISLPEDDFAFEQSMFDVVPPLTGGAEVPKPTTWDGQGDPPQFVRPGEYLEEKPDVYYSY